MRSYAKKLISPYAFAVACIFLAAAIWGASFVTQRLAMDHMGALTYNGIRFALGAVSLLPAIKTLERKILPAADKKTNRRTWKVGLAGGGILFIAANLQQFGIALSNSPSSASEAGFITGMYTVFVPILGLALGRKTNVFVWVSAVLAFGGLALISMGPGGLAAFQATDLLLLLCAVFWAAHILLIDHYVNEIRPLSFAAVQFAVCAVACLVCALVFEGIRLQGLRDGLWVLLFGGIVASGVAYSLQIIGQRRVEPSRAAIIFSLESLFAAVSEAVFLGVLMTPQKYLGGAMIFVGILLSQRQKNEKT